jgi:hypothetical protein
LALPGPVCVSFTTARQCSPPSTNRAPRPVTNDRNRGGRCDAVLESVLGATPREFESRILRPADLQEHPSWQLAGGHFALAWAQLAVSIASPGRCHRRDQPSCCAWSRTSRTGPNGGAHAAESCGRRTAETRHDRSTCSRNVTAEDVMAAPEPPFCRQSPSVGRAAAPRQNGPFLRDGEPCQGQTARVSVETIYNPLQH